MRTFSTLGWFMIEALGALHVDDTKDPVIRAWMIDADFDSKETRRQYMVADHARSTIHVIGPPTCSNESSRVSRKETDHVSR